jgi:hypothetical protein
VYSITAVKLDGEKEHGISECRWNDNIKIGFRETGQNPAGLR